MLYQIHQNALNNIKIAPFSEKPINQQQQYKQAAFPQPNFSAYDNDENMIMAPMNKTPTKKRGNYDGENSYQQHSNSKQYSHDRH